MPRKVRQLVEKITDKLGGHTNKSSSHKDASTESKGKAAVSNRPVSTSAASPKPRRQDATTQNGQARQSHDGLLNTEKRLSHNGDLESETEQGTIPRVPVGRPNGSILKAPTGGDHQFEKLPDIETGDGLGWNQDGSDELSNGITTNGVKAVASHDKIDSLQKNVPDTDRDSNFGLNQEMSNLRINGGGAQLGNLPGIDLNDTVDTEHNIHHAPAVTHEVVQPQVHEIVEEQITRDFHTYDEYRYIQPVYELEILPARHFVEGVDGGLVEVSESDLPDCTGANQRWEIAERQVLTGTHRQFDIIAKQVDEGKTLVPGKNLLLGKHVGSAKHADEARLLEH